MREKKEKKPKIKKIGGAKLQLSASSLMFVGLSLLLTLALFVGLVLLQGFLLEEVTYQKAVVAKSDMQKGTIITEENVSELFTAKEMNVLDLIGGAITDPYELIGRQAIIPLYAGEIVALKDFENISSYTSKFKEPVEVSIKVSDIADADGGKLRAGDIVNLTMLFTSEQLGRTNVSGTSTVTSGSNSNVRSTASLFDEFSAVAAGKGDEYYAEQAEKEAEEAEDTAKKETATTTPTTTVTPVQPASYRYSTWAQYVMEDLYVTKVLDSSGAEIAAGDDASSASILIFVIEKEDEEALNNALANSISIRLSKVLIKPASGFEGLVEQEGPILEEPEESTTNPIAAEWFGEGEEQE